MKISYDTDQTIESIYREINNGQEFSMLNINQYNIPQLVTILENLTLATYASNDNYKNWMALPDAQQTWQNFKTRFLLHEKRNKF